MARGRVRTAASEIADSGEAGRFMIRSATASQLKSYLAITVADVAGMGSLAYLATGGGTVSAFSKVAAATIAAGQAVRPNPVGLLVLAQADTTNNAKGVLIASGPAAPTFTLVLAQKFLTLSDWTAAIGFAALSTNAEYFLSPSTAGQLTTTVPTSGVVLHIGTALDTVTLALSGADPITL